MLKSLCIFSIHPVCVLRPGDGEEGGKGVAQGGRGHQVRHPPDQEGQPHVCQTAVQVRVFTAVLLPIIVKTNEKKTHQLLLLPEPLT